MGLAAAVLLGVATAVAAWLYVVLWVRPRRTIDYFRALGVPAKPFVPVLGQLAEIGEVLKAEGDGGMVRYWMRSAEELGDNFVFCVGPQPFLLLSDPDYYRDIFTSRASCYQKTSETNKSLLRPLLGNGLLLSEGEFWKRQRESVEPFFHHLSLASLVPSMVECADALAARWAAAGAGGEVEIHHALAGVGLDVVGTAAFGKSFHDDPEASQAITVALMKGLEEVRERVVISMVPVLNRAPLPSLRRFEAHCAVIRGAVRKVVEARRAEGREEPRDLLDTLLRLGMPERQLLDECVNFMAAGAETTSNLMTWLLYHLAKRPDLWRRCADEVAEVLPDGAAPTYETLRRLTFLEACAYEALRLNAPAPAINKLAVRDHTIRVGKDRREMRIPAGTNVMVHGQIVHRNAGQWPDPEEFNPYRFLDGDAADGAGPRRPPAERHTFAWVGFSHGPRKCLGKNFAMLEIKAVFARLLQQFTFELVPGQDIHPDRSSQSPKHGIRLRIATAAAGGVGSAERHAREAGDLRLAKPVGMI